jgi:uncharacterized protein (DUF433 family)
MVTRPRAYTHIVRDQEILGGEPVVAGTRLPVRAVALTNRYAPNAEYIYSAYPFATREEIDEALAYYQDHQPEIDQYIAENEDDEDD